MTARDAAERTRIDKQGRRAVKALRQLSITKRRLGVHYAAPIAGLTEGEQSLVRNALKARRRARRA